MKSVKLWLERYLGHPEALSIATLLLVTSVLLKLLSGIITPILLSIIISYFGISAVHKLANFGMPRWLSFWIVYGLFLGLVFWFIFGLLPLLWGELRNLLMSVPSILEDFKQILADWHYRFPKVLPQQIELLTQQLSQGITLLFKPILSFSFASLLSLATCVVYLVMIPLLVFFFIRDEAPILAWFSTFLPKRPLILIKIWQEIRLKLQIYIKGKVTVSLLTGLVTLLAFQTFKLRYATLLSFLSALSVFVPYVGLVVVTALIVIVALFQWGFTPAFWYIILIHALIEFLQANILEPIFFAELMQLTPLVVILAVLICGHLFGFWGIFLAIPLAAFFQILLKNWPIKENLKKIDHNP